MEDWRACIANWRLVGGSVITGGVSNEADDDDDEDDAELDGVALFTLLADDACLAALSLVTRQYDDVNDQLLLILQRLRLRLDEDDEPNIAGAIRQCCRYRQQEW